MEYERFILIGVTVAVFIAWGVMASSPHAPIQQNGLVVVTQDEEGYLPSVLVPANSSGMNTSYLAVSLSKEGVYYHLMLVNFSEQYLLYVSNVDNHSNNAVVIYGAPSMDPETQLAVAQLSTNSDPLAQDGRARAAFQPPFVLTPPNSSVSVDLFTSHGIFYVVEVPQFFNVSLEFAVHHDQFSGYVLEVHVGNLRPGELILLKVYGPDGRVEAIEPILVD